MRVEKSLRRITRAVFLAALLLPVISPSVFGQSAEQAASSPAADTARTKILELEAQVRLMLAEIEKLKLAVETEKAPAAERQTEDRRSAPAAAESAALPKQEKPLPGVELGGLRLIPYGTVFFNAFGNSGGTNNADVPLWAAPGAAGSSASLRQTRFGVRVEGARVGSANVKAAVEADFYGGFPAVGVGENFGVVRLRLANVRFDWERTSLVLGQDWIPFAPNSPVSPAAAAIPQMAAAGNNWSRLPQVRLEQKIGQNVLFQAAVLAPGTGDFPSGTNSPFLLQPGSGASSHIPFFQSRIAYSEGDWFGSGKRGTIGFAGHYGRSKVTSGAQREEVDSVGAAADWNFPLAKRVQFSGEAFFGRNLGGFQAGIFQGYNADFAFRDGTVLRPGGVRAIGTRGGWAQIGWNLPAFADRVTALASFGIDDPRNGDLVSMSRINFRSRNLVYAIDLIYKLSPQFSLGGEFRRMHTDYLFTGTRRANHFNLGASYSF